MEQLKLYLGRLITPRPKSDLSSEILNLAGGPLYLYTITYVVYFGYAHLVDYHYGNANAEDGQPFIWYFQKCFACLIWIQMMSNWACLRFVDTSLKNELKHRNVPKATEKPKVIPDSVIIDHSKCNAFSLRANGHVKPNNTKVGVNGSFSDDAPLTQRRSYWSWKRCEHCDLNAPPRCHHCPFCNTCIMKRDHHCFFAGRCVGFHNQRHFIVFLIWAAFGTSYAMVHFIPYLYAVVLQDISAVDCFAPVAVLKLMFGYLGFYYVNLICSFTLNLFFILLSTTFLIEQYTLVDKGLTQFEQTKVDTRKLKIADLRQFPDKLRAVLGNYPIVSLLFPMAHWIFPPQDDPFEWPDHVIKHV